MDCGLHDDGSARADHGGGGGKAGSGTCGVDGEVEFCLGDFTGEQGASDAGLARNVELVRMAAVEADGGSVDVQHLGDEQAELAVAQNRNRRARRNRRLVEDFAGGGEGFDENGVMRGYGGGDGMKVAVGQSKELGKSPGVAEDAKDGAVGAMAAESAATPIAEVAVQVDFSGDPFSPQGRRVGFDHFANELVTGPAAKAVVTAKQLEISVADAGSEQANEGVTFPAARLGHAAKLDTVVFQVNGKHGGVETRPQYNQRFMPTGLICFEAACRAEYKVTEVIYNCPKCGGLLEAGHDFSGVDAEKLKMVWRERRMSNAPLDQSGVWRYRELIPFLEDYSAAVTLREGNTPLLEAPRAAKWAGLDRITFKHQGFNPTGSFKDNGMTCGASQARRLGMKRVACVSTGNTSASMAAYASAGGLQSVIFIPHGNISYGKLAQALEYGARTLQVEANFDQILKLVRVLAERLGIYLLNSINPFRIEGQKTIMAEMLDQRDWRVPDWVVVPGGNLGNVSAFGKGLRELRELGFIDRMPRLAVIQAEGSAPFYEYMQGAGAFRAVEHPETLATAIKIGDPVSWPKARHEVETSAGLVEKVSEQEIADSKAMIGLSGIGCEPASAATLAGIRKLVAAGRMDKGADVVAVLTGNLLKDPDYIYRYHTGQLESPGGGTLSSRYGNRPVLVSNDEEKISAILVDEG
jgi:threonine synthase